MSRPDNVTARCVVIPEVLDATRRAGSDAAVGEWAMPVFAVIYHYDPARHDLRMERRPEHRAFLGALESDGVLIAGGAWTDDGAPGGLLVARAVDLASVTAAFDRDPYHRLGVLAHREIREWAQLFGPWRTEG